MSHPVNLGQSGKVWICLSVSVLHLQHSRGMWVNLRAGGPCELVLSPATGIAFDPVANRVLGRLGAV